MPNALVVLSSGIGNVVRWTPAIAMLHQSGYEVDVFLDAVDYAEVATLLLGAPAIREVFGTMPRGEYDVAWVSQFYKTPSQSSNGGRITRMPTELWRQLGDPGAMLWHAAHIGWAKPIPAPFVMKSERQFDLPPGTLAIHAGCNPGAPWKKYPNFPAVARQFEHVVIVGAEGDEIAEPWPFHAKSYVGQLSLLDTAALLSQCAALVCNDSGLSHVGAALGIPVFAVYGATDPEREAMKLPNMFMIVNQIACHRGCGIRTPRRCVDRPNVPHCLWQIHPDAVAQMIRAQMVKTETVPA